MYTRRSIYSDEGIAKIKEYVHSVLNRGSAQYNVTNFNAAVGGKKVPGKTAVENHGMDSRNERTLGGLASFNMIFFLRCTTKGRVNILLE